MPDDALRGVLWGAPTSATGLQHHMHLAPWPDYWPLEVRVGSPGRDLPRGRGRYDIPCSIRTVGACRAVHVVPRAGDRSDRAPPRPDSRRPRRGAMAIWRWIYLEVQGVESDVRLALGG